MAHRSLSIMGALVLTGATCLAATVTGCSSPNRPSVSVVSAQPVAPANATQVSYYSQPVTLVVANGVATGGASPATTLEVATDAAFTAIVITKMFQPGVNGQSTVTLDHLNAATTYYWRVKTTAGNNPGTVSSPESFSIGPQLVIQPPTPVQPLADTFPHKRPTFIVTDAAHTGPPATLTYRFDIASDPNVNTRVATGSVAETPNQTSFTPATDLTSGATYYWRAQATDTTTGVASDYSSPQPFTTVNPDDGLFRYILTLHLVSASKCVGWTGNPAAAPPLRDVALDSGLVVSGDHLRYTDNSSYFEPVELDIERRGNQFSGTLRGDIDWPGKLHFFVGVNAPTVSGTADNMTGSLAGTGYGAFSDEGFPAYTFCQAVFAIMLTPHP